MTRKVKEKILSGYKRTYVDPFKNLKRNLVFLGSFLGLYGYAILNVICGYDLAKEGYQTVLFFNAMAYIPAGFLFWPLLYLGFSAYDSLKWRAFLIAIQLGSFALYFYSPQDAIFKGLISGIVMAPFWTIHHIAMVQNTTKDNRGYEVSLALFITLASSFFASLSSGFFLETSRQNIGLYVALGGMLAATLCFLFSTKIVRQHRVSKFIQECKEVAKQNPYMFRRIVSHSTFDISTLTIASLMYLVGLSPTLMATILIARLFVVSFLSPLIGTIAHTYRKRGYEIGLAVFGTAWLVLVPSPGNAALFFIFVVVFGVGMRIADGSMLTGLYEMQSYASMMWSEVYLGIGRMIGMALILPLLFWDVRIYLVTLALLAYAIIFANRRWQRLYTSAEAM